MKAHLLIAPVLAAGPTIFVASVLLAAPATSGPNGAIIFQQKCAACHQAHGEGLAGAFPKLAGDKFVVGDPTAVARRLLDGRKAMPSFKSTLKDEEIAAVLTHIRTNWGNKAGPVTPAIVATARASK